MITVPTPINSNKQPDFVPLERASITVGEALKLRSSRRKSNGQQLISPIVIYESTVFPGATEEICVPILEKYSNQIFNEDFFCGYSPERINPGDAEHRLSTITKVTSGSTSEVACWVDNLRFDYYSRHP